MPKPELHIYTDGSCKWHKNPKRRHGGWAFIALSTRADESNVYRKGYAKPPQTNNTMEMQAVLEALRWAPKDSPVVIYADSLYVINGMTSAFRHQIADGLIEAPNSDLWLELHEEAEQFKKLSFRHVKGHAGDTWNEMCDVLAGKARTDGIKRGE